MFPLFIPLTPHEAEPEPVRINGAQFVNPKKNNQIKLTEESLSGVKFCPEKF